MNILVTGGCGFVGSNLVDLLAQDKDNKILVIDNLDTGKKDYCNNKAEYIFADIRDIFSTSLHDLAIRRTITKAHTSFLRNIDVVYHLAALARIQPSFKRPLETINVNAFGTALVCEYARSIGAKLIYSGSSSFYAGTSLNPYAFAKWQGEEVCRMYSEVYDLKTTIARFFNVYGPRHPSQGPYATVVGIFEGLTKNKKPLTIVGTGEQRRDFTHVDDICNGLVSISKDNYKGEVFNLGTGTNYSINELAEFFGGEKEFIPQRPGEASITLADISKTAEKTGWKPNIKLENYISEWLDKTTNTNKGA
jgi:UDP-glucose 4-epimerase